MQVILWYLLDTCSQHLYLFSWFLSKAYNEVVISEVVATWKSLFHRMFHGLSPARQVPRAQIRDFDEAIGAKYGSVVSASCVGEHIRENRSKLFSPVRRSSGIINADFINCEMPGLLRTLCHQKRRANSISFD
jgi:hypothetical protein